MSAAKVSHRADSASRTDPAEPQKNERCVENESDEQPQAAPASRASRLWRRRLVCLLALLPVVAVAVGALVTRDAWLPRVQSWLGRRAITLLNRLRIQKRPMLTPASIMKLRRVMAATMAAC